MIEVMTFANCIFNGDYSLNLVMEQMLIEIVDINEATWS